MVDGRKGSFLEKLLEPVKKDGPPPLQKRHPLLYKILLELKISSDKALKFVFSAVTLGVIDSFGPKNYINFNSAAATLNKFLPGQLQYVLPILSGNGLYQTLLFSGDVLLAAWSLHDGRWRRLRNLPNLAMAAPNAVIMDYSSASINAGTPAPFPLPSADYSWRDHTFDHTVWNGLARWINEPSRFIPGAIQGYDLLVYVPLAYIALQSTISLVKYYYLNKRKIDAPSPKESS